MQDPDRVLSAKDATALRARAAQAARKGHRFTLDLAAIVWEVATLRTTEDTSLWEAWGFETFLDYVERELGLSGRTASQMRIVWEVFGVKLQGSWHEDQLVGLTKMAMLAPVVSSATASEWLLRAKSMTIRELAGALETESGESTPASKYDLHARLTATELRDVQAAMHHVRRIYGDRTQGAQLARIARGWLSAFRKAKKAA